MITPPAPSDANYWGLYSSLANVLNQCGVATLRFENRAFVNKGAMTAGQVSMFDQADDLNNAFVALKKDPRFATAKIGLLGHSEGGNAAAIVTSKNKDISFVVLLSTVGVDGAKFAYYQSTLRFDYVKMSAQQRNWLMYDIRSKIGLVEQYSDTILLKQKMEKYLCESYGDSINKKNAYGKLSLQQVYDMTIPKWINPHLIAVVQYKPELYYSQISCPTLLMYGKMDEMLDWKSNLDGIETIFMKNKKENYEIVALDTINHSYQQCKAYIPSFISVSRPPDWKPQYSERAWNRIANWILKQ